MVRGLYTASGGMMAQQIRYDVLAENLANVSTTGYRRQVTGVHGFTAVLDEQLTAFDLPSIIPSPTRTLVHSRTDDAPGPTHLTGNPCDFALEGDAYFTIQFADGEQAYTRNGAFALNANQQLVTQDGDLVLGERGPITITSDDWSVSLRGEVIVNGAVVDTLKLVSITPRDLSFATRAKHTAFQTPNATPVTGNIRVQQGYLEGANVNAISEMITLLTATRNFESCQQAVQAVDSTLQRAVNDIAR